MKIDVVKKKHTGKFPLWSGKTKLSSPSVSGFGNYCLLPHLSIFINH